MTTNHRPERFTILRLIYSGGAIAVESAVTAREIKFPSDTAMAEFRLGVTVTSLYTLVSLGLILAFT
jgi:hypothetical protein